MAFVILPAAKNARADAITAQLGTGATLRIYTTGYATLLATWSWTGNVFSAATGSGSLAMNPPTTNPVTPVLNGVAAIARLSKSDGTTFIINDLTVGTSATDVILSNITLATTAPVTLNSIAITEAA